MTVFLNESQSCLCGRQFGDCSLTNPGVRKVEAAFDTPAQHSPIPGKFVVRMGASSEETPLEGEFALKCRLLAEGKGYVYGRFDFCRLVVDDIGPVPPGAHSFERSPL